MFEIGKQYEFRMLEDYEGGRGETKFSGKIKEYEFPLITLEDRHIPKHILQFNFSDENSDIKETQRLESEERILKGKIINVTSLYFISAVPEE